MRAADRTPSAQSGKDTGAVLGSAGLAGIAASVALIAITGVLGPSVTQPSLGPRAWHPPYDVGADPSPWLVTSMLVAALLIGAVGVAAALAGVRRGWLPPLRRLLAAGGLAVAVLALVPPMGSSDHLSYVAYGRIAAEGANPYVVAPEDFRGGTDPVASAAEAPWRGVTSVYGPLATAEQAAASAMAGTSVRGTVLLLSVVNVLSVLAVGLLLVRLARDEAARVRSVLLWGLNPLVLWALVAGAHVDALGVGLGIAALAVVRRSPLAAGVLAGASTSVKLTMALYAVALVWPLRRDLAAAARVALGAALVVLPALVVAGPHALDQVRRASRYISLGTPWQLVEEAFDSWLGRDTSRPVIGALAVVVAAALVVVLARVTPDVTARNRTEGSWGAAVPRTDPLLPLHAARAAFVLSCAWVLAAPYSLPWYDAAVWAPLALLPASRLDLLLLGRGALLACAYVPGRTVAMPEPLRRLMVDRLRTLVTPWSLLAGTALLASMAARRRAGPPPRHAPAP